MAKTPKSLFGFTGLVKFFQRLLPSAEPGVAERRALRTAKRFAKQAADGFRDATRTEIAAMGFSPGSRRMVAKSVKRVTRRTPSLSRRAGLERQAVEPETGKRVSLEKLAERRRAGEVPYKTAAAEKQAERQHETRRRAALIKIALKAPPPFTQDALEPVIPGTRHHGRTYKISAARPEVIDTLTRKIVHKQYIEEGKWHETIDWLRAHNQEELVDLFRNSGKSTPGEGIIL